MRYIEKENIEYKKICHHCGGLIIYNESDVKIDKSYYSERDVTYESEYIACPKCFCKNYIKDREV